LVKLEKLAHQAGNMDLINEMREAERRLKAGVSSA
jgi:hypothetical protein